MSAGWAGGAPSTAAPRTAKQRTRGSRDAPGFDVPGAKTRASSAESAFALRFFEDAFVALAPLPDRSFRSPLSGKRDRGEGCPSTLSNRVLR